MNQPSVTRRIGRHRIHPDLSLTQLDKHLRHVMETHARHWLLRSQHVQALSEQSETLTHTLRWLCSGTEWTVITLETNGLMTELSRLSVPSHQAAQAWLGRLRGAQTTEEHSALTHLGVSVPLEEQLPQGIWRQVITRPGLNTRPQRTLTAPERPLGQAPLHAPIPTRLLQLRH